TTSRVSASSSTSSTAAIRPPYDGNSGGLNNSSGSRLAVPLLFSGPSASQSGRTCIKRTVVLFVWYGCCAEGRRQGRTWRSHAPADPGRRGGPCLGRGPGGALDRRPRLEAAHEQEWSLRRVRVQGGAAGRSRGSRGIDLRRAGGAARSRRPT